MTLLIELGLKHLLKSAELEFDSMQVTVAEPREGLLQPPLSTMNCPPEI
jgi:hypothetical protein